VHDILGLHKVCAWWAPKYWTEEQKRDHLDISSRLLELYHNEGENCFNQIITGDETWIHHYNQESKHQSVQWKHTASPSSKKFKTQSSARKVMLTVFWDSQGPIFEHCQERETTVTSLKYRDMLRNELKPAIRKKTDRKIVAGCSFVARQRPPSF
jgi:histone-lysine N-methyltransferase SETMAR